MTIQNACTDEPSVRDYSYEPVFGAAAPLPNWFELPLGTIQNQGAEHVTRMGCTRFGLTHSVNAQNGYLSLQTSSEFVTLEAKPLWLEYLKLLPSAEANGATLQSALEQFRKKGLITGYAVTKTVEEMKASISAGRPIYTGSQNGNWDWADNANKVYRLRTDGRIVGHAFCIIGFTPAGWVGINSYGQDNGTFTMPYDLTETLFTRYSVMDSNDEEAILLYKKNTMDAISIKEAKEAYELGLWNGERPTEPATREEVMAMALRAARATQKPA